MPENETEISNCPFTECQKSGNTPSSNNATVRRIYGVTKPITEAINVRKLVILKNGNGSQKTGISSNSSNEKKLPTASKKKMSNTFCAGFFS